MGEKKENFALEKNEKSSPGFLQEILQLIMEKNEVCFLLYKHFKCV